MIQSSDSDKISRGVHTINSVPTEVLIDEVNQSASLASEIYDNIEAFNYTCTNKVGDSTTSDPIEYCTESGDVTQDLYVMKTNPKSNPSPSKLEFRLYKSKLRKTQRRKKSVKSARKEVTPRVYVHKKLEKPPQIMEQVREENSFFNRLKTSFTKMRQSNNEHKMEKNFVERMDIYYFDHGNSAYFRTTDCPPQILSEILANQTTHYATRFWAEIFGSLHIGMTFFVTFFMQAYRFLLYSILRAIIVGFLQMTSDYFVKPIITIIFNGLLQPPLILMYNIFSSFRDMLEPVAITFGNFLKPVAGLLKAVRLININIKKEEVRKILQEV